MSKKVYAPPVSEAGTSGVCPPIATSVEDVYKKSNAFSLPTHVRERMHNPATPYTKPWGNDCSKLSNLSEHIACLMRECGLTPVDMSGRLSMCKTYDSIHRFQAAIGTGTNYIRTKAYYVVVNDHNKAAFRSLVDFFNAVQLVSSCTLDCISILTNPEYIIWCGEDYYTNGSVHSLAQLRRQIMTVLPNGESDCCPFCLEPLAWEVGSDMDECVQSLTTPGTHNEVGQFQVCAAFACEHKAHFNCWPNDGGSSCPVCRCTQKRNVILRFRSR